jgi:hypothetical protein
MKLRWIGMSTLLALPLLMGLVSKPASAETVIVKPRVIIGTPRPRPVRWVPGHYTPPRYRRYWVPGHWSYSYGRRYWTPGIYRNY